MSLRTLSARMVRSYMPKHTRAVPFALYRYYASAYRLFRLSTAQVLEHVCRRVTCHPTKRFTSDHEWISVDGDIGTVGITDYAQRALGDVVFVEIPAIGRVANRGDQIGAVESVKAASDIYAPVSGEVVGVNDQLSNEPTLINEDPEGEGWLAKLKLTNKAELDDLLDEAAYIEHCEAADSH
ncbi:glycine cleavage system H protein [Jimgerdemannia flammicorona]|uniref:Glycine cleavage system H protein n=1 Tax=Jimgerdemannia flammicorona TaxID=994334 RepID=A0A433QMX3_9FUNG|nr:glycine cleavage system H protein [Jimgerdemannia flammicorona]